MAGDTEICGFLDAKLSGNRYVSQRVKKRSLAPWKAWKRHWCCVKKLGPGLGVEIQLDCGISSGGAAVLNQKGSVITVPFDAVVYRTRSKSKQFAFGIFPSKEKKPLLYLSGNSETETQRWMLNIRRSLKPRKHRFMEGTYDVSLVDNAHSRLAGLTGLHGDLVASRIGVFIKDVHSGEIVQSLEWKELSQFHLTTIGRPEDVKRICVIHTTKQFRAGIGELHVFCLDAGRLLQDLVTQGRGPKHKHVDQRPLSLSEGDLRISNQCEEAAGTFPGLKNKIACSLINAGLGLLLSSRSNGEAKSLSDVTDNGVLDKIANIKRSLHARAVDNVYQPEPASIPNVELSLEELEIPSHRRISSISMASGVYEEILDNGNCVKPAIVPSNFYEDPGEMVFGPCGAQLQPPPLPPRQRCGSGSTRNGSASDDGLDSEGGTKSITSIARDETMTLLDDVHRTTIDTSEYVPMSPRPKDASSYPLTDQKTPQEEVYMIMR